MGLTIKLPNIYNKGCSRPPDNGILKVAQLPKDAKGSGRSHLQLRLDCDGMIPRLEVAVLGVVNVGHKLHRLVAD